MSRSFRDLMKLSVPALLSAALLAGCGSGSSGSSDLDDGGSVASPPPPVTVTETFNFLSTSACCFVVGTEPIHARFAGGEAKDTGAWIIPAGRTASVDFGTPADAVKFSTKDNYTAAAAGTGTGAEKATVLPRGSQKVDAPFDTAMYIRGSVRGDWAVLPENQLSEVSDNVLAVTVPLTLHPRMQQRFPEPGDYHRDCG